MKKFLIVVSLLSTVLLAKSQNLTVEGTAPKLYINHTVAPRENFYSVGRLYNQNAKSIATFNNIVMEKGLVIGQHIKIPLTSENLDVSGSAAPGGAVIPLTHVVAKNESLSKIGSDHNVSTQLIKQWNNLSSDNIAPGTPLVVGHLKMQSTAGIAKITSNPSVNNQPPVAKQEAIIESKPVAVEPKKEVTSTVSASIPVAEKKEEVPMAKPESSNPVAATTSEKEAPVKEITSKQEDVKEMAVKPAETKKQENYSYSGLNNLGSVEGVFSTVFTTDASQKSLSTKSGEAATFKSTSGWQDKKYYVLINDVTPGTILKITSTENKVVYAKVLGSMPEMKENNGLLMRVSNAAASYLGIIDPKFPVQVSYYQ